MTAWTDISSPPQEVDGDIVLVWHALQGVMISRREGCANNRFHTHWQALPEEGWIDAAEREPAKEDGDALRCVLARHTLYGIRVTGWHQIAQDRGYTHWMRTPEPPGKSR